MKVNLGNWTIQKADDAADDLTITVKMIANRLEVDKENQQILKQAFNKATVNNFLKYGIVDWHHKSVTGKNAQERSSAIIGRPVDFKWEEGLPVVYAKLTKAHPIVKNAILPHLEANQSVFAASVGGNIKKAQNVMNPKLSQITEQVLEFDWEHIAIAGSPYVISSGSSVSLVKAADSTISEPCIDFSDITAFERDLDLCLKGDEIRKALEMGSNTNSAELVGADALRMQSNQKSSLNYKSLLHDVGMGLKTDMIGGSEKAVKYYLKARGLSDTDVTAFMTKFKESVSDLEEDLLNNSN